MPDLEISITGYLVGPIWWPAGAECWKSLNYDVTREESRWTSKGTLRQHVLAASNDGDFQGCSIAQGALLVKKTTYGADGRRYVQYREFPLSKFPSVADCLHDDPDWLPCSYDDED